MNEINGLIVIYPTCPVGFGGGGQRWDQFSEIFVKYGWSVIVLDTMHPIPHSVPGEPESDIKVLIVAQPRAGTDISMKEYKERGFICIYDLVDKWSGLNDGWYKEDNERKLIAVSDLVSVTCLELKHHAERLGGKRFTIVPNAANKDRFFRQKTLPNRVMKGEITIGYFGSCWGKWFDWALIKALALRNPKWVINLAGQYQYFGKDGRTVTGISYAYHQLWNQQNVRFHGIIPHKRLNLFINACDVAIIPFDQSEVSKCTDPVKAYEYVLTQIPVVSSFFPALDSTFPDINIIAERYSERSDKSGFYMVRTSERMDTLSAWERAILSASKWAGNYDQDFVESCTWDARYRSLMLTIQELYGDTKIKIDRPGVSVIIPAWNDAKQLRRTLTDLSNQTKRPDNIIVVDNFSADGTSAVCQELGARFIEKRGNISVARNEGARISEHKILAFTDCGCYLHPRWLESLLNLCVARDGCMSSSVVYGKTYPGNPLREEFGREIYGSGQRNLNGFLPSASSLLMRKKTFDFIGGFDEALDNGEDTEFDIRARNKGVLILATQDRLCEHEVIFSWRDLFSQYWKFGWWDWIANPERDPGYQFLTQSLARWEPHTPRGCINFGSAMGWANGKTHRLIKNKVGESSKIELEWAHGPHIDFLRSNAISIIKKPRMAVLMPRQNDLPTDVLSMLNAMSRRWNIVVFSNQSEPISRRFLSFVRGRFDTTLDLRIRDFEPDAVYVVGGIETWSSGWAHRRGKMSAMLDHASLVKEFEKVDPWEVIKFS